MGTLCMILGALSLVMSSTVVGIVFGIAALILYFIIKSKGSEKDKRWARVGMVGAAFGLTSSLMTIVLSIVGAQYAG